MSGIDTVKYNAWPLALYGKVTKTQEYTQSKNAKRSALSQQVSIRLQETDKTSYKYKHEK